MIGLSLSFCIRDILNNSISMNDVDVIYSSANIENFTFEEIIHYYQQDYWLGFPNSASVAQELYLKKKIKFLPQLRSQLNLLSNGHWLPIIQFQAPLTHLEIQKIFCFQQKSFSKQDIAAVLELSKLSRPTSC